MRFDEYRDHVRYLTKTNTITLTDAEIVRFSNIFIDNFAQAIEERNQSYFDMQMVTDLVADQRDYALPDDWMNRIIRVSVNLDGTNLQKATPIDFSTYDGTLEEEEIRRKFSNSYGIPWTFGRGLITPLTPRYTILRKCIIILTGDAIVDVPGGLELWSKIYPAKISETELNSTREMSVDPSDTSVALPRQFHELLARRVAIEYKQTRDRPIPLNEREQLFSKDFEMALDAITEDNLDAHNTVFLPYNDGSRY